jgi:hypothetical protein
VSSHPHGADAGMDDDTGDLADRTRRATLRAADDAAAARRAALPGRAYWATLSTTGALTLLAWGGLLVDLVHDNTNRIGYRGAITLAAAALLALASMITIAVGANDYRANLRADRMATQLDIQHRAVMRVLNTLLDQPSGMGGHNQRHWTELAGLMKNANDAHEGSVVPIVGGPRHRNGRSG